MKTAKFTRPLSVAYEKHTFQKIKKISEAMQLSMADVVRDIMDKALSEVKLENDVDHCTK
jgi:hypothetical protein